MSAVGPPKFKAFKKTKVVLSLEPTPSPFVENTDLTAFSPSAFRDAVGQGPTAKIQGPEADVVAATTTGPEMFAKKARKAKKPAEGLAAASGVLSGFPGLAKKKATEKAPGPPQVYSRLDVISRDLQAAQIGKLPEALQALAKGLLDVETSNPYEVQPPPDAFVPLSRRGFGSFLVNKYGPIFPKAAQRALDVATCAAKGEEGAKEVKIYHYQAFIREYLRFETPYRGLLVYHGLGSGKTCSAIAAAEALFGTRGLKVIVMTPFSLRDNFISEISFCGFKHFRLQNHWTPISLMAGSTPEPGMVKLFAQNVYGIPDSFFAKRARGRPELTRIWIPDFDKPSNFDKLGPEEKDEIQTQLKATIENRIKFINYNGITARELKTMVCSTPEIFDNAVIVVDEIHNLTRLIQGSLEPYFNNPAGRRRTTPLETLTPDRKKLPLCGMTKNYLRGYLFYRLFMDAKNTKIIGLSGTPLINFPEELGILMNILHGPIHTIEFMVAVEGSREIEPLIRKAVDLNENLDTVFFQASQGSLSVTVTRLPEQFTKILNDDSEILGISRRDPSKGIPSLDEVWKTLEVALKADKIVLRGKPTLKAQELLPSWDAPFRGAFIQEDGITLKRTRVLQQRIRGLVSYYRGIQGDVMPRVIKDEIVGVPLTGYALKIYNKLRNQEIQVEMSKPKQAGTGSDAVWAEIGEMASMTTPSNYRMSSRQACNFVFPESVTRPRPRNLEEQDTETGKDRDIIIDVDVEDKVAGREQTEEEKAVEIEDKAIKIEVAADVTVAATGTLEAKAAAGAALLGTREQAEAYRLAIKSSKEKLRKMGPTHLQVDGPASSNLGKYSPKFAAMLTKINSLSGSSLVYSQFLEMEGIGIFGICMEANGYVPIEIVPGADGKLKFSERSETSLLKGPKANEKRYIEFTGTGSKEQRGAAVNVFNARLDKLPPAIEKVLKDGGWTNNFDGGLCRVFCITSAGAEGLSLKCVRGVHIMEPYWNTVRTQQVKGRAVRICSHTDLPKDQQNVEIYTYCTTIPEEAILAQAVDKTLERSDTYSANDAKALGVPVPPPAKVGIEIPGDMFLKVEAVAEEEVPQGAQVTKEGAIRFSPKLDNEYRGFSNYAPSPVVIRGQRYPSVEHYVQASKFTNYATGREQIRVAPTPAKAKQLADQMKEMMRPDWDSVREGVMLEGLRAKFQQNAGLLEQLKATGVRPLIEATQGDAFWSEGRSGKGKNRIGKLLEQVREELREYVIEAAPLPSVPAAAAVVPAAAPAAIAVPALPAADNSGASSPIGISSPIRGASPIDSPLVAPPPDEFFTDQGEDEGEGEDDGQPKTTLGRLDGDFSEMPALVPQTPPAAVPAGQQGGAGEEDRMIILTSDQKVLLISLRKEKVIGSLQTLMKSVAVDCQLNFHDNNDGSYRCLSLGDSIGDFAYHPNLERDIQETEAKYGEDKGFVIAAPVAMPAAAPAAPMPAADALPAAAPAAAAVAADALPAMPAADAPPMPEPPAVVKPKPKRIEYKKKLYYYKVKLDEAGKPLGYLFFDQTDPELETPVGYVIANPVTRMPKGDILPVPVE